MCIFFGELLQDCDHAECQIVSTIKSLNQKTLFQQPVGQRKQPPQLPNTIVSISNLMDEPQEPPLKIEEKEAPSLDYRQEGGQMLKEDFYLWKIEKLQQQVRELRQLTYWMKNQLQKRGILP